MLVLASSTADVHYKYYAWKIQSKTNGEESNGGTN